MALGLARRAHIPPVQYQPMMSLANQPLGNICHKRAFGDKRIGRIVGKPYAVRHTEHVRVNRHRRLVEHHRKYHVGSLAPHAGYLCQFLKRTGHFAAIAVNQGIGHPHQRARLVVGESDAFYVFKNIFRRGFCHRLGRGISLEQCRSDHVDALVGTLRRQYHGHEQLKRCAVLQLGLGHRHILFKPFYNCLVSLLRRHSLF